MLNLPACFSVKFLPGAERINQPYGLPGQQPDNLCCWEAVPLCNVQTGHLWGSRIALTDALAYLNGEEISPPKADWDVGHFVTLAGSVEGNKRSLLLVRDTYSIFGWDGYHLQPQDAIASALRRNDGKEGGVFLFVAAENQAEVEQQAREQSFDIASWDNGTPIRCDGQPQSS